MNVARLMTALFICLFSFVLIVGFSAPVKAATVIYYEDVAPDHSGLLHANMMFNLVGHFDPGVELQDVTAYSAGDMANYDFTIYIGSEDNTLPGAFLSDVASGSHNVLWIDGNIWQLDPYLGNPSSIGYRISNWYPGGNYGLINYNSHLYERDSSDWSYYEVVVDGTATIYSYLESVVADDPALPHFTCGNNVCYLAENPFWFIYNDERYFIMIDLLHEFFQSGIPPTKKALIRFEDLCPVLCDLNILRTRTDQLEALGIPFSFGVIPVFKDPEGLIYPAGTEFHFSDDPDFVATINYMLAHGGTMLMHGITHQHDNGISRVDWEFTYGLSNEPLTYDSYTWANSRVLWGLSEFATYGWRPTIWETPHYSASHGDYLVFSEHHNYYYEKPLVFPKHPDDPGVFATQMNPTEMMMPYYSPVGASGMGIIPENMGYISRGEGYTPEVLLEEADKVGIIRDGVASFFFHHDTVAEADLFQVINGLLNKGYTFVSPEELIDDDDDDMDADFYGLDAISEVDAIRVQWETGNEDNVAGWNLYRSLGPNGELVRLNSEVIMPGQFEYEYVDTDVDLLKRYCYQVERLDRRTNIDMFGPTCAAPTTQLMSDLEEESKENAVNVAEDDDSGYGCGG